MFKNSSLLILAFIFCLNAKAQEQTVQEFQKEHNKMFKNPKESPLKKKARKFKGHDFFIVDDSLRVEAKLVRTLNAIPFQMKTSTSRLPIYNKYGEAHFTIDGQKLKLSIFQSERLSLTDEFENYLFLPFNDLSNGEESYTGGRYIDLEVPVGDTIVINFNKSYNPYCAYSSDYSCPIPPEENFLPIKILAGVKKPNKSVH